VSVRDWIEGEAAGEGKAALAHGEDLRVFHESLRKPLATGLV
jgi:hypothetical protein